MKNKKQPRDLSENLKESTWIVIPVFNNAATVKDVAERCQKVLKNVLIVDDGSDDADLTALFDGSNITVLRHEKNTGKGAAILTALDFLVRRDAKYMITVDADGQHYPEDIPKFFPFLEKNDYSLVIGCRDFATSHIMPSSRHGRRIANFWMQLETGIKIDDCQSGFRAYPVKYIAQMKFLCKHYNFETEVLVRAAWANLQLHCVSVRTWYAKPELRVSHFKPWLDCFRISCIHAHLVGCRVLPLPRKKLIKEPAKKAFSLWHPLAFIKYLLRENTTPGGLAMAAAVGTFWAVLPIVGFHSVAIIYFAARLRLNKIMAFNIQHLFMPPFTPVFCMEIGYWILNGKFLFVINFETLVQQLPQRVLEWWLGAAVMAPVFALITGSITFFCASMLKKRLKKT